jgi:type IV pilus assembly protein PilX
MSETPSSSLSPCKRQDGLSLIFALIFLTLLSMLALSALRNVTLEERMAGNNQDQHLAIQSAEAALRDCETVLQGVTVPAFTNSNGLYQPAAAGSPQRWESVDWSSATAVRALAANTLPEVSDQPACIIESLGTAPSGNIGGSLRAGLAQGSVNVYRVTARGSGNRDSTVVMLQSTYAR